MSASWPIDRVKEAWYRSGAYTYLNDHPNLRFPVLRDRHECEILGHALPPVPVLGQDLLLASRSADLPPESRTSVVPQAQRDLAPRIERNDVQDVHPRPTFKLFWAMSSSTRRTLPSGNTVRDAFHLFKQIGREAADANAELFRLLTDMRPVELACLFEEVAIDRELVEDLRG